MIKIRSNNFFKKYSIFRILGNETPPRDEPDARLNTLKFILDNEPNFPNVMKGWVINCVHDRIRRDLISEILTEKNQYVVVVPMRKDLYASAKSKSEKIVHLIGINSARNVAIDHGKLLSKFTFVLDGDCFFTETLWNKTCEEIEVDQKLVGRKFYSIPSSRTTFENSKFSNPMLVAEPMLAFRHDSKKYFDEKIPFGQGDKLKLLYDLGHSKDINKHHILVNQNLCKSVGLVQHVSASDYKIETDQKLRTKLRNESIDKLIWQVENPSIAFAEYESRKHNRPNNYWSKIQGWFDFRGLYSHFAWKSLDGCKFVEVGCWLGKSVCYLATEFKNRNKNVQIFAVDTWKGSDEKPHKKLIENLGGTEALYQQFLQNIKNAGVSDVVKPIRMPSVEASKLFEDESLDIVFIDASHKYEDVLNDIKFWYPKVRKNGIISGHDYVVGNKTSEFGVIRAVNSFFLGSNLEISKFNRTWSHQKK